MREVIVYDSFLNNDGTRYKREGYLIKFISLNNDIMAIVELSDGEIYFTNINLVKFKYPTN